MDLIQENVSALASKLGTQPEVITKFLTDAAASEEVKPFVDTLGTLQVFSEPDFTTRLANERQLAATEATNTTLGKTYGAVDRRVEEATGIKKNAGEPTLDYQERAFREKFGKTTDSEESQRLRDDLKAAKDLLTAKNNEFETYKTTKEKETAKQRIDSALDKPLSELPLADASQQEFVRFRFDQKYTAHLNGETVEYKDKATGEVVRDQRTAAPMTAEALLQQFAPTVPGVLFKKTSVTSGSGFQSSSTITTTESGPTMDYAGLTSYDDFKKAVSQKGFAFGSEEAGKLYEGLKKARPDLIPK